MTNNPAAAPQISFVDNPHAPDVFADDATGILFLSGCIRITFESARVSQ